MRRNGGQQLAALKREQPALGPVPPDGEGKTEAVCRRLERELFGAARASLCGTKHARRASSRPARVEKPAAGKAPANPSPPVGLPLVELPLLDPGPVTAARMAEARRLNSAGLKRHHAVDHAGAIAQFTLAVKANPGHLLARYNLACAYARAGRAEMAIRCLGQLARSGTPASKKLLDGARKDRDLESRWGMDAFKTLRPGSTSHVQ